MNSNPSEQSQAAHPFRRKTLSQVSEDHFLEEEILAHLKIDNLERRKFNPLED
jgi:hypothetical protein